MSDDRDWIDDLYAESGEELPPAALDDTVLAAARDSATRPWYRDLRYLATVATAASFVLAAMIVYYAPGEPERGLVATPPPSPAAARMPSKIEARTGSSLGEAELAPAAPADAGRSAVEEQADTAPGRAMLRAEPPAAFDRAAVTEPPREAADVLDQLISLCGNAPGDRESRRLLEDALGWYLRVTAADSLNYYRCQEGEWRQIEGPVSEPPDSDQQQDAEDDQ
ncbi:MAG TPA: hypothetical protein VIS76_14560 [Pseudomonadales bacterium]